MMLSTLSGELLVTPLHLPPRSSSLHNLMYLFNLTWVFTERT
jgi:hypothetical protein